MKVPKFLLQLTVMPAVPPNFCYWCGQGLRQCGMCKGSGQFKGEQCVACKGKSRICPNHEGDW